MYRSRSEVNGVFELVRDHLSAVGKLAGEFAAAWGGAEEATVAGQMHDIGKYGDKFQGLLEHTEAHVDHWTAGANLALRQYQRAAIAVALAIQGHHAGLQTAEPALLTKSLMMADQPRPSDRRQWAGNPTAELLARWRKDCAFPLPTELHSQRQRHAGYPVAAMLDVRMLFSALVDADWLSAEAHQNRDDDGPVYRPAGPPLEEAGDVDRLLAHMRALRAGTQARDAVRQARDDLFERCMAAGGEPRGLFTLAAPTGCGKTLSMLAFALNHCRKHKLRRIIVVLPYLSILDQTLDTYQKVLRGRSIDYVIEDDSLTRDMAGASPRLRQLAENWDAPVVITTTVRFFQSLFSNRPGDCRKLHRIADSVILFDEAQTMPLHLAMPTLSAVAALCQDYGCSAVFSTATQPAFEAIAQPVKGLAGRAWEPREICDENRQLFQQLRRVNVVYEEAPISLPELAREVSRKGTALAIVNMKRHAAVLYRALERQCGQSALHLSTSMCPAHRREVLKRIRRRLSDGEPCVVAATQCVEAGVDLDFPVLYRALAPLDALCQAAGRCNREGRLASGTMHVFVPESDGGKPYPDPSYARGAALVQTMAHNSGFPDLFDPEVIRQYYTSFYARSEAQLQAATEALSEAIARQDFALVAELYRWIDQAGVNILVPYQECQDLYDELSSAALEGRVNGEWFRRARQITVGAFPRRDSAAMGWLLPVKKGKEVIPNWHVLIKPDLYQESVGLTLEEADDLNNFTLSNN